MAMEGVGLHVVIFSKHKKSRSGFKYLISKKKIFCSRVRSGGGVRLRSVPIAV